MPSDSPPGSPACPHPPTPPRLASSTLFPAPSQNQALNVCSLLVRGDMEGFVPKTVASTPLLPPFSMGAMFSPQALLNSDLAILLRTAFGLSNRKDLYEWWAGNHAGPFMVIFLNSQGSNVRKTAWSSGTGGETGVWTSVGAFPNPFWMFSPDLPSLQRAMVPLPFAPAQSSYFQSLDFATAF